MKENFHNIKRACIQTKISTNKIKEERKTKFIMVQQPTPTSILQRKRLLLF